MEQDIIIGLVTGTVSSIWVTLIMNFIAKKKNEKNLLYDAVQTYTKYGFEVIKSLGRYVEDNNNNNSKEARRMMEDIIDKYPHHTGFHYTNSNILKEFLKVINDIEYDMICRRLDNQKAFKYCEKIQHIRSNMLEIKYDLFYKWRK